MKKFLKSSEGFTLVELMVVVAIIGILSAVAIPNFKKYQAKSKQSEAKIALAALYTAEVGANADFDTYATCLTEIGYETPPKGYYIVGFAADEATSRGIITGKGAPCTATSFAIAPPAAEHMRANSAQALPTAAALAADDTPPTSTGFVAVAAGNISTAVAFDIWSMDQAKNLDLKTQGY